VLTARLRKTFKRDIKIYGYDTGFFAHCLTASPQLPENLLDIQYVGDVRSFDESIVEGIDAVVHLSAISNDPMGNRFEVVTNEINHLASVKLAHCCAAAGVKHFVFASSCSIYGYAEGGARKESDTLNPLTAYARSKVAMENALEKIASNDMTITSLRFATACGMSNRLRLDLVLNDFVAGALASRQITVLSDGTPWRPLIDVKDMARAIEWAIQRPQENIGAYLAVNAGSNEWNYQVRELANAVAKIIPGTAVKINQNAPPDKRSYQVDFSLFKSLAPNHQPQVSLKQSINEIKAGL
jgi:nucleoside-diphosphate-sugar epimerase